MKFKFDVFAEQAIHLDFFGLKVICSLGMHRTVQSCTALPDIKPLLRLSRFHGDSQSKRKDNSSQDPHWRLQV